jgi:hypothetical protein
MKIPGGILLSPATCAHIGPALQDFLASRRVSGLRTPEDVRLELQEVAELGRRFQTAQLAKRQADVRLGEHSLATSTDPSVAGCSWSVVSALSRERVLAILSQLVPVLTGLRRQ